MINKLKVSDIIKRLEKKYPKQNAESWDNVGLLVGDNRQEVQKIQVSLDVTEKVIDHAVENNVDLIISHHPMIFSPLKAINNNSLNGRKILKLIKSDIAVYSMHTNLDSSPEGLNEYITELLGWKDTKIIDEEYLDMYKMSVFVPVEWYPGVMKKVEESGLELNNYGSVSFTSDVSERYVDIEKETLHANKNKKIEIIGEKNKLYEILGNIKKIHPYDEVAYEIVKIENKYIKNGIGRYCVLKKAKTIEEIISETKSKLGIDSLRLVSRDSKKQVKRVAIVNGSGMSFFKKLKRLKIDLFLTGDVKYHEGLDAIEEGISVLDIGHYESEHFFHDLITKLLSGDNDLKVDVYNDIPVFKQV